MECRAAGARIGLVTRLAGLLALLAGLDLVTMPAYAAAPTTPDPAPPSAVWPLDPHPVVASFDPPGCFFCAGHRGIDIGALPGASVRAATAGDVTFAGMLAGRGVVVVDDGTRRLTYEPVAAALPRGAHVRAGDTIGSLELPGSHCYPDACLHLGLIDDATDDYLDPMSLFGQTGPVRLLPLWSDQPVPFADLFGWA